MKYCSRCVYPENHAYGITFDSQGVCSGCRIHEEKDRINWKLKILKLKKILNEYKKKSQNNFDCIIPVTGGSDSFFIVDIIKNKFKLNPLLVTYNTHYNTRVGIRNLAKLQTVFDCDLLTLTIDPNLIKKITKYTLKKFGSIYWHVLAGQTSFPVQTAIKYKIPLIVWGAHGFSDQAGMFSHLDEVEMTERCRNEHALMGIKPEDLLLKGSGINRNDIQNFIYPYDNEIEKIGLRGIYLSNYIRWDSKLQHEEMIRKYNYETSLQNRTFNTYEDVHCFLSADLHDYIKLLKFGYSRVYDHASREIRLKRFSRDYAINLIQKYSKKFPKKLKIFCKWLGITESKFIKNVETFRNMKIWKKNKNTFYQTSSIHEYQNNFISQVSFKTKGNKNFKINSPNSWDKEDNFILMGRGYEDKYNFGSIKDRPKKKSVK